MKVIDLINMINNKEDLPERMIINKRSFHSNVFKSMIYEKDCNTDIWMAINLQHIDLDDTVKLTEDEIDIDKIEEVSIVNTSYKPTPCDMEFIAKKFNELIQAVKQLNKEIKSIKEK